MGYDKIVDMFYSFNVRADITIEDLADLISDIAVPVVRCKDCKHYEETDSRIGTCLLTVSGAEVDGFCSWGERREDAQ